MGNLQRKKQSPAELRGNWGNANYNNEISTFHPSYRQSDKTPDNMNHWLRYIKRTLETQPRVNVVPDRSRAIIPVVFVLTGDSP